MQMHNKPLSRRDNPIELSHRIAGDAELRVLDAEARTVEAVLSTDAAVDFGYRREKLVHSTAAIDMTRSAGGLPLLFMHNQEQPIGIVESLRIAGGKLVGLLKFAKNDLAERIFADVKDGMLRSISIGYRVLSGAPADGVFVADRWSIYEASIVTVPADPNAQLLRTGPTGNVESFAEAAAAAALARGRQEGQTLEIQRRGAIANLFNAPRFADHSALRERAIAELWTVERAKDELLTAIGAGQVPVAGGVTGMVEGRGSAYAGTDQMEKFAEGVDLAIRARNNLATDEEKKGLKNNDFLGMTLPEIAREYCVRMGVRVAGANRDRVVMLAMSKRFGIAQGSGDFTGILENIAGKSLLMGYDEQEETWRMIARVGSVPDFKQNSRPGLSSFDDLPIVPENSEYTIGSLGDRVEKLTLETRGKLLRLSRQAITNDDQGAFTNIPRLMGRAAQRAIGDMVYSVLTTNANLGQDGLALFVAGHSNIQSPGAAPTVVQVNAMKVLMAKQKDSAAAVNGLNISMTRVVVPKALEYTARTLQIAGTDPASSNASVPNIHQGTFETVADVRLDAASAIIWYGMADPNRYDTIEVAFLDGQETPFLESHDGWTIDGVEFKVRLDAVAKALDFRTMVRNAGV